MRDLWMLALAFLGLTQIVSIYVLLDIGAKLDVVWSELMSIGVAVDAMAYVEDDGAPGMIERLDAWLAAQEAERRVDEIVARAHLADEKTDGGASWGCIE